jgi:hypothetical protein
MMAAAATCGRRFLAAWCYEARPPARRGKVGADAAAVAPLLCQRAPASLDSDESRTSIRAAACKNNRLFKRNHHIDQATTRHNNMGEAFWLWGANDLVILNAI